MKCHIWLDTCYPDNRELRAYLTDKNIESVQTSTANGHPVFKYTGSREQLVELIDLFWYDPDLHANIETAKTTIEVLVEDKETDVRMEVSIDVACDTDWLTEVTLSPACILAEDDPDGSWSVIQLYYNSVASYMQWLNQYF